MNAIPMNLNPGNAVQTQPQVGKQADAAVADTPFSLVLSGEIARKGSEPREGSEFDAVDAALQLTGAIGATPDLAPLAAGDSATELIPLETGDAPTDLALLAVGEAIQGVHDAKIEVASPQPEAMLGLAMPPEWPKPAPAASAESAADLPDGLAVALDTRAGRALPQDTQTAAATAEAPQVRPVTTSQTAAPTASPATAPAAAFAEQLAVARQSDDAKAGEHVAELMSHPGMRAAVHAAAAEAVSAAADPASSRLAPGVGTPAWGQALGDKLVWMATGAQQTASLTLNPPNLGPLQVVLNVTNDQATASFYAVQPEVRQALESALPRLREMMTDAGIQLGQATVSADTPRQNDTPDRQAQRIAPEFLTNPAGTNTATQPGNAAPATRSGRGLVDTFA